MTKYARDILIIKVLNAVIGAARIYLKEYV